MSQDKKSLRAKLLKDRLALSAEDWQARSLAIAERIAAHPDMRFFTDIALYKSFRNEVDISPLMNLLPNKNYYFPRTDLDAGTMEFLRYESPDSFSVNRWGLHEPHRGEALPKGSGVLILVPALAFDRKGHRLGYGKGFYDRFLSTSPSATLGVCFSEFFFDKLPSESHDRVVHCVVTELGCLDVTPLRP